MIDFNRWIYAKDIAAWLAQNVSLNLEEQIECICAAPHRTLEEKLEGVKELKTEYDGKALRDKIENIKMTLHHSQSATLKYPYLFGIEIFFRGEKDCFMPYMIFRTAEDAINGICYHIEQTAAEEQMEKRNFYGVVNVLRKAVRMPYGFITIQKNIIRYDGKVVYVQNIYSEMGGHVANEIDMGYFDAVKLPYPSGTIVSISENPYIPAWKGVLVNTTEPDEEGFLDDRYNQWLIYPASEHTNRTHGIGFVNLRDDYAPFENSPDFIFPYKQLITAYEGDLKEKETWLSEFSGLIKTDKSCIRKLLHDREPKNYRQVSLNEERLRYVRELAAQQR